MHISKAKLIAKAWTHTHLVIGWSKKKKKERRLNQI